MPMVSSWGTVTYTRIGALHTLIFIPSRGVLAELNNNRFGWVAMQLGAPSFPGICVPLLRRLETSAFIFVGERELNWVFKLFVSYSFEHWWYCLWTKIRRSPLEVHSSSHYLRRGFYIQTGGGWPWDFWSINSRNPVWTPGWGRYGGNTDLHGHLTRIKNWYIFLRQSDHVMNSQVSKCSALRYGFWCFDFFEVWWHYADSIS